MSNKQSTVEVKKSPAAAVPASPTYTQSDGTHALVTVTNDFGQVVAVLPHASASIAALVAAAYRV